MPISLMSLAVLGNGTPKHSFTALGIPDQVIDDQVDAVFISLILHVETIICNAMLNNKKVLQRRLKPTKAPNVWGSNPDAYGGLKPASVNMAVF